jgi:hypothetical protein
MSFPVDLNKSDSFESAVYGPYGLLTWTENGISYSATYEAGKIKTVTGNGITKTFTWSGDNLISAVDS